mmetsp:Transcript_7004/g.20328  ORF Transcript_7004/g.20328 Transcript_7004/m.20328 type:complete len:285 (-) Transcript_7004:109-963(-)
MRYVHTRRRNLTADHNPEAQRPIHRGPGRLGCHWFPSRGSSTNRHSLRRAAGNCRSSSPPGRSPPSVGSSPPSPRPARGCSGPDWTCPTSARRRSRHPSVAACFGCSRGFRGPFPKCPTGRRRSAASAPLPTMMARERAKTQIRARSGRRRARSAAARSECPPVFRRGNRERWSRRNSPHPVSQRVDRLPAWAARLLPQISWAAAARETATADCGDKTRTGTGGSAPGCTFCRPCLRPWASAIVFVESRGRRPVPPQRPCGDGSGQWRPSFRSRELETNWQPIK